MFSLIEMVEQHIIIIIIVTIIIIIIIIIREFSEMWFLYLDTLWNCTKNPRKYFFYINSEYYLPNLTNANCIKVVAIANSHSYL